MYEKLVFGVSLKQISYFESRSVKTEYFGRQSLMSIGLKLWILVQPNIQNLETVAAFKRARKKWKSENCPCRQYKIYLLQVGFI